MDRNGSWAHDFHGQGVSQNFGKCYSILCHFQINGMPQNLCLSALNFKCCQSRQWYDVGFNVTVSVIHDTCLHTSSILVIYVNFNFNYIAQHNKWYRSGLSVAIQAWRTGILWQLGPSHCHFLGADLATGGLYFRFGVCIYCQ